MQVPEHVMETLLSAKQRANARSKTANGASSSSFLDPEERIMDDQYLPPDVYQDISQTGIRQIAPDLLSPRLNAAFLLASDEFFCSAANLNIPTAPIHRPNTFTERGAWYDGWETRRHNPEPYDYAVWRLGVHAGTVRGVEIDTGYFSGNHAPEIEVQGCCRLSGGDSQPSSSGGMHGYREGVSGGVKTAHDTDALEAEERKQNEIVTGRDFPRWTTILPRSKCGPACKQAWLLPPAYQGRGRQLEPGAWTSHKISQEDEAMYTHIRLLMYPDGGIARFRLYGNVVPPPLPRQTPTSPIGGLSTNPVIDLASVNNGGIAIAASDAYFSPPNNLLLDGRGTDMSDGWETKRSREVGHNDWVIVRLGGQGGYPEKIVVDTAFYRGNYPVSCHVQAWRGEGAPRDGNDDKWEDLGYIDQCGPDREHEMTLDDINKSKCVSFVKLVIVPDGGVKRLRGSSGAPEVRSGYPSPPESPPLATTATAYDYISASSSQRSHSTSPTRFASSSGTRIAGAAYTITEECERLFCGQLAALFLGEKGASRGPLGIGALDRDACQMNNTKQMRQMTPPDESLIGLQLQRFEHSYTAEYFEMWDYVGDARFRGFTVDSPESRQKTLFVFFDAIVIAKDLKPALMALIELASTPGLACEQLVICVERPTSPPATSAVVRDLGWVGFEPATLEQWAGGADLTSRRWFFMGMEV
ncbi:MAG: hypothetical protein Q9159_000962 [Coniocarpon cinnabarinum]